MDQTTAKQKLRELIEKYKKAAAAGRLKRYSEEETKKDFILPLFEILGWDVYNKHEVSAEEHIKSSGRVDYGFYLHERPKFYLEAKALGADLRKEEYARQSIRYSWNRGVTWAALTDFESIKVFNAQGLSPHLGDKLFFEISCNEYLERFNQLWLLSKEAFGKDQINIEAERVGKKLQRVSVGVQLYRDLSECRAILTKELSAWNKGIDRDLLDEGVQRLLDRIIFLRVAEDRGIEPPTLLPLIRGWKDSQKKQHLYQSMVEKFRELDKVYNSNLFLPHPLEKWEEYSGATEKVVNILYGKGGYYEYDFKAIPADTLGSVYENYLGYRLAQSKKGVTLDRDSKKRKEHGIYYTPTFIVDYIVKNTLRPLLDQCQSIEDIQKIKVLDPACGSGSFLIKALEVINNKYKSFGNPGNVWTKLMILSQNLYGVDLDEQAVEIARLNFLINVFDERIKFPLLSNIKIGNSLVSGTDKELKKYFGANFREKKPFNWEEEFPGVFKQGGFDVVIGNPPWISNDNVVLEEKNFLKDQYEVANGRFDIANVFVERALTVLREGGVLGFVMPEHVWIGEYFRPFREYLEKNSSITEILSSKEGSFAQVSNPSSVFLTRKTIMKTRSQNIMVGTFTIDKLEKHNVRTSITDRVIFDDFVHKLKNRIGTKLFPALEEVATVTDGIQTANLLKDIFTQDPKNKKDYVRALRSGASIRFRYAPISWDDWWVLKPELTRHLKRSGFSYDSPKRMKCFEATEKIVLRQTEPTILATLDTNGYYFPNSIFQIAVEKGALEKLKFLLGVINSRFFRFYYSKLSQVEGTTKPQIYLNILKSLPIPKFSQSVAEFADKMLDLNKRLAEVEENSNEWERLRSEITKTDKKIDERVYKLYGLTQEEIKIVENQ